MAPFFPYRRKQSAALKQISTFTRLLLVFAALLDSENASSSTRFYNALTDEEKRRRDRRIPRPSLLLPFNSAWEMVYKSGNDQGLITLCGLDNKSFRLLHEKFKPYYKTYSPYGADGTIVRVRRDRGRK